MKKPEDLAVAHVAASPSEAELVRTLLEAAGIFAVVADRHSAFPCDLTPLDGEYKLTGCEVLVAANAVDRAKTAIQEARQAGDRGAEDEGDEDEPEDDEE